MKTRFYISALILFMMALGTSAKGETTHPDTVKIGTYVISLHDINFRDKEYTARYWLWMLYKNKAFDFVKQVEIPNAKSTEQPEIITDTIDGTIYVLMKMKSTMKQSWDVLDYPFDNQYLHIHVENTIFDSKKLIFKADTADSKCDPNINVDGWKVKEFKLTTGVNPYPTSFGYPTDNTHHSEYANFNIFIRLERNAWGLFLKIFLGMYIAFFISMVTFILRPSEIEPRFGLPVGGLFAAVGNKYIIDSILPESSSFTLVDSLHSLTFLFIFFIIASAASSLFIENRGYPEKAIKFDRICSIGILSAYIIINVVLVLLAIFHY